MVALLAPPRRRNRPSPGEEEDGAEDEDEAVAVVGLRATRKARAPLKEPAKRLAFYEKQDWARLQQLLIDSGMLERDASEMGGVKVVIERASAGLSIHQLLGAISPSLLPRCSLPCLLIQRSVDRNSAPQAPWPCSPSRRSTT